jgi:hypothetical protein
MLKVFASLIVCAILVCVQPALAEDSMYRCGNTYQDTPCKGVVSKPINEPKPKKANISVHETPVTKKVVAAKEPAPTLQADCKKSGEDAKVIGKLRDIGVPEQDQVAITTDKAKITLIKKVYSLSGNAFQVQNAVEKECLQQSQKISLTSQWMAKAKKILGFGTSATTSKPKSTPIKVAPAKPAQSPIRSTADPKLVEIPPEPTIPMPAPIMPPEPQAVPAAEPSPAAQPVPEPQPAPEPKPEPAPAPPAKPAPAPAKEDVQDDPQGICSALKAGMKNVADEKRKGGDAARMTDLKNQQIQLENLYKSSGC